MITIHSFNSNDIKEKIESQESFNNDNNLFKVNIELVKKVIPFFCARNDFYWEYTNKGVPFMKKESFDLNKILEHISTKKVLGFPPFIDNDKISFGAYDFDAHTSKELTQEENDNLIKEADEDSLKVYQFLKELNLPVILNSSGSKGKHIRILCYGAKAKDIRIFMRYVLDKVLGNADKHEIFPKQDDLNEKRIYGNQIKGCFGKHQKRNNRSNIISNGRELDLFDSIIYASQIVDNYNSYSPITMTEEDYNKYKIKEYKNPELKETELSSNNLNDVPKYCDVFEKIFSKVPVPSKGRHTRHQTLDPNMASYGIEHPEIRRDYQEVQERFSNTAIDNWANYWENDKPVFNCPQIIGFLKTYSEENKACAKGLKLCHNCPRFKNFLNEQQEPQGWAKSLNIFKIANKRNFFICPDCKTPFSFIERLGWFNCKCKKGGIKKFMLLFVKTKREGKLESLKELNEAHKLKLEQETKPVEIIEEIKEELIVISKPMSNKELMEMVI